jgi:RNA polymerase sigma-70 factor (sigma-E family)
MNAKGDAYALRPEAGASLLPATATQDSAPTAARALPRDEVIAGLYRSHYTALVRAAALLVGDVATAEGVVQDSFVAMHHAWWRLRDPNKALPYLRRAVMNRARSVLQHRVVVDRHAPGPAPQPSGTEEEALTMLARSAVLTALDTLPIRQRQVIVLHYFADLSEAQIADAMGIAKGSVKSHTARALDSLWAALR